MVPYVSDSSIELAPDRSIGELMQYNISQTPDDKIIYEDTLTGKSATYGAFRQQVKQLAWGLRAKSGLKRGDIVAIVSPSCVDYLVILHAVWYAGAVISTINHSSSSSELEYALELIKPRFLVVNGLKSYSTATFKAVSKIQDPPIIFSISQRVRDLTLLPHDYSDVLVGDLCFSLKGQDAWKACAAIILSSGTTGSPKAVMLSHHNLVASSEQMRHHNPDNWNGDQREVFFPPLSHIYGIYVCATMTYWLGAYTMMMAHFDLKQYLQLMSTKGATLARIVPTIAKDLAQSPIVKNYSYPSLKYFSCSAAPLTPNVASALKKAFPSIAICQTYGCTEVSGAISQSGIRDTLCPLVSGGSLIANASIRLVKNSGEDIPEDVTEGQSGEILVKGPMVMMGYKDNLEATVESKTKDGQWYRTGDIGVMDHNGYLSIVDRIKDIIKYNGFQVSPTELEEIISRHPTVAEVCVIGKWDESQCTEVPCAFVVVKSPVLEVPATAVAIVAFTKNQTSGYKQLRGGVQFIRQLPKSATGKILRKELRKQATEAKTGAPKL